MKFPRLEYWSGVPFLSPGDLPDPGIEPGSPTLQADSLLSEPPGKAPGNKYEHLSTKRADKVWTFPLAREITNLSLTQFSFVQILSTLSWSYPSGFLVAQLASTKSE